MFETLGLVPIITKGKKKIYTTGKDPVKRKKMDEIEERNSEL
jgi:hypothetical protein